MSAEVRQVVAVVETDIGVATATANGVTMIDVLRVCIAVEGTSVVTGRTSASVEAEVSSRHVELLRGDGKKDERGGQEGEELAA